MRECSKDNGQINGQLHIEIERGAELFSPIISASHPFLAVLSVKLPPTKGILHRAANVSPALRYGYKE